MSQLPELYPGPSPQDEMAMEGNAAFIEACKAGIATEIEQFEWRLGESILTRSKDGCLVWRVDFETRLSGTPGLVNRMVFWLPPGRDPDSIARAFLFGQPLAKLK